MKQKLFAICRRCAQPIESVVEPPITAEDRYPVHTCGMQNELREVRW
jgi:hypothetical protein